MQLQCFAEFRSPKAQAYFTTLVRHFAHKIPVQEEVAQARLEFVCGTAVLTTSENLLSITVTAANAREMKETCDVVERHLLRFAHRETPAPLLWSDPV